MRLMLVIPPLFYARRWTRCRTSHLLNLFSWVRRKNPDVEVVVLDLDREMGSLDQPTDVHRLRAAFADALERTAPDVVGISCWTSLHYTGTVELARLVKRRDPAIPVIVGGYHATGLPQDFAEPPGLFDYVVRGEGEIALSTILAEGPSVSPRGPRVVNGPALPMEEEELLFDEFPYHAPGVYEVFLSRGCPFPCGFCIEPSMVEMRGAGWRAYSWEKTEALLRDLVERRGATSLVIGDAIFGAKKSFRHAVWKLLAGFERPPAVWCETRVDLLDDVDYDFLARLPIHLDVGLDAITLESIERMRKSLHPAQYLESFHRFLEAMALRRKYVRAYLIVNYPGETLETLGGTVAAVEATVDDLRRRHGKSNLFVGVQPYQLFPGSPDYGRLRDFERLYGARFPNDGWWREAAPAPEVRAAAYLPSERLLREGGLGAARSAIEHIRTVCRKHGLPAVHNTYGDEDSEIPPRRFRGTSFADLLAGNPRCFDRLAIVTPPDIQIVDGAPAVMYSALLDYSTRLDPATLELIRALLRAPTLEEGIAAHAPDEEGRARALGKVLELLDLGFLDCRHPRREGLAASRLALETTEGGLALEAAGAPAAELLGAWLESGYLTGLAVTESWSGLYSLVPVPRFAPALPDPERRPPSSGAGLFLGTGTGRLWPTLAIAQEPGALPDTQLWRPVARIVGPVPALSVRSRILELAAAEPARA